MLDFFNNEFASSLKTQLASNSRGYYHLSFDSKYGRFQVYLLLHLVQLLLYMGT